MKVNLVLFLLFSIIEINSSLEKEYAIHDNNPRVTVKLSYTCSENPTSNQNSLNFAPENINFDFSTMIATFKETNIEGTINFIFASNGIKIDIIINSKDLKCDENFEKIQNGVNQLLSGENLIRFMAMYVSGGKVKKGEDRKALLGIYYDEVQKKVDWAYKTAKEVWKGYYPNGEANRRKAFGADYDLVQFWVNQLKPFIYIPTNLSKTTDNSGKRYLIKNVPTARGNITWKGYNHTVKEVILILLMEVVVDLCLFMVLYLLLKDIMICQLNMQKKNLNLSLEQKNALSVFGLDANFLKVKV
jgi:hypothetical protein